MAITRIVVHGKDGTLAAISGLFECLLWSVGAGIIFIMFFLGRIGDSFTNFIFGKKEYLNEKPMLLSHARGFIANGEYEEAALLLQELYGQYPDSPDLNLLLFEFYYDKCGKKEFAGELAENYLKKASIISPDNVILLLRYCDYCIEFGEDKDDVIDFLLDQSVKKIYLEHDKKRIMERIKGLNYE